MDVTPSLPQCASCPVDPPDRACRIPDGSGPEYCPTINMEPVIEDASEYYQDEDLREFARQSSIQEAECYAGRTAKPFVRHPVKPRLQEICEFANRMGYRRLGVAFCSGLLKEGNLLAQVLGKQGFEVISVVCKVGCTPKEQIGIKDEEKVRIGEFEPMCSPIAQAKILNEAGTEFNIMMGLCVGHDSLFFRHSDALVTVFAVKDRVMGHNPMASLYTLDSYYERFVTP